MSDVEVREVDPGDEEELRRWWEAGHEAMAGRPYDLGPSWQTTRAVMSRPHDDFEVTLLADGALAGYSDIFIPAHEDRFAQIGITMVLPEHRGHSLGLALKLVTHAALTALVPECGLVVTDNADANAAMNAVNDQLGYRLVEQQLEVQKEL